MKLKSSRTSYPSFRVSKGFLLFLAVWGCLNLLQASFTILHYDEAYYWLWSRHLDWGFFDHPPLIALMIGAGYSLFGNEVGVRLFTVLSQVAALILIWSLLNEEKKKEPRNILLMAIIISVLPVMNIYGFIATPDSPLLFFSALFLFCYKRFLKDKNWGIIVLLGLSMAGLVYSKYHGLLMILLVMMSNLKLLKCPKFYLASIFAFLLFVPHIVWQFSNDFPSIRFHLTDRASGFELKNIPEYLLNQLVIFNPFLFPVCLWLIFKKKVKDNFDSALKYIIAGFLIFFLASAFRYHVEPQWTALITFPVIILLFNNVEFNPRFSRYIKWTSAFVLPVIVLARLALMIDFLPVPFIKNEFHNNMKRIEEIEKLAGERPVVFTNSYKDPSVYTFYTGKFAHSLDNKDYRKTQFDLWNFEEQLHGKEILYIPHWLDDYYKSNMSFCTLIYGDTLYYRIFKDFQSLQRNCVILKNNSYSFNREGTNLIDFRVFDPYPYPVKIKHPEFPVSFEVIFIKKGRIEYVEKIEIPQDVTVINPGDTISISSEFHASDMAEGKYKFAIGTTSGLIYDAINSNFRNATIIK